MAYSPWENETVEVVNKVVMAACRALSTELKLGPQGWPTLVPVIASVMNEAPIARLGKRDNGFFFRSPFEAMTGIQPNRNIVVGTAPMKENSERLTVDRIQAEQLVELRNFTMLSFPCTRL